MGRRASERWFCVVALFEPEDVGTEFARAAWPPHVTLAGNFTTTVTLAEVESAALPVVVTRYPLVLRFTEDARLGPDEDVAVRLVEPLTTAIAHHRVTERLETLTAFRADQPGHWRAPGYRPHLTLGRGLAPRSGDILRAHSVALVELLGTSAVLRAVRPIEDLAPSDRVDLAVALPLDERSETVEIVQIGGDVQYPSSVSVETATGLRISTSRRDGVRWRPWGWAPPEETLHRIAASAIASRLIAQRLDQAGADESEHGIQQAEERGTRLAALLRDPEVWDVGPIDVDGVRFALFSIDVDGARIAVADLGDAIVTVSALEPLPFALHRVPASTLGPPPTR